MDLHYPIRVLHRADGLINFYIFHPAGYTWGEYRTYANQNRALVNSIRSQCPEVMNEMRQVPTYYYDIHGNARDNHFCFYGLTKAQYMMIKLSWTFKEIKLKAKFKPNANGEVVNDYVAKAYVQPSEECRLRFAKPGYKPKALKILG